MNRYISMIIVLLLLLYFTPLCYGFTMVLILEGNLECDAHV